MECAEKVSGVMSVAFLSNTMERPPRAMEDLAARIVAGLGGAGSEQIGIEGDRLPVALLERLRFACPALKAEWLTGFPHLL